MSQNIDPREQARRLRESGNSFGMISKVLNIPKTTVYRWAANSPEVPGAHPGLALTPATSQQGTSGYQRVTRIFARTPSSPAYVFQSPQPAPILIQQQPQAYSKPFDPLGYTFKKSIDAMFERATRQPPAQNQIDMRELVSRFEAQRSLQDERRREEREAEARKQEEERTKERAEYERTLAQMGEASWKLWDEMSRKRQADNTEIVNTFREFAVDNSNRVRDLIHANHDGAMKLQELRNVHAAERSAAVQDEIRFLREAGRIVDNMLYPTPKNPHPFTEHPAMQMHQFIHNEAREEMQRRVEIERRDRNIQIQAGLAVFGVVIGLALLARYRNQQYEKQ